MSRSPSQYFIFGYKVNYLSEEQGDRLEKLEWGDSQIDDFRVAYRGVDLMEAAAIGIELEKPFDLVGWYEIQEFDPDTFKDRAKEAKEKFYDEGLDEKLSEILGEKVKDQEPRMLTASYYG